MLAIDLKCQPRQRQNGKWMFTIFGNNRWEESGSEFSTSEEAVRAGAERVEQIERTRLAKDSAAPKLRAAPDTHQKHLQDCKQSDFRITPQARSSRAASPTNGSLTCWTPLLATLRYLGTS
ncbi:hypothetical protein SAMN05443247_07193 [Bradyrhizobium erythrophlei]|nr:hypothetical protein SAMN05443247_07193 [Bradyrhizobium erythrophlei]